MTDTSATLAYPVVAPPVRKAQRRSSSTAHIRPRVLSDVLPYGRFALTLTVFQQHSLPPGWSGDRLRVVDRKHRAEMLAAFGVPSLALLIYLVLLLARWLQGASS